MSLVGEERKSIILDLINTKGQTKTVDLVKRFKVSSETIRRYMEELEADNKLKRVYGGAVKINMAGEEPSLGSKINFAPFRTGRQRFWPAGSWGTRYE